MNFLDWVKENGNLEIVTSSDAALDLFEEYLDDLKAHNPKYVGRIKYKRFVHKQAILFSKAVKFRSPVGEICFMLRARIMISRWYEINSEGSHHSDSDDGSDIIGAR